MFQDGVRRMAVPILGIGGLVSGILVFLLVYTNRRKRYWAVRHTGYAILGASVILAGLFPVMYWNMRPDERYVTDGAYRDLCVNVLKAGWSQAGAVVILSALLGVVCLAMARLLYTRANGRR